MTAPDRRRITTRTLENAGAFPSDACGARHPPGTAPTARTSRNQPSPGERAAALDGRLAALEPLGRLGAQLAVLGEVVAPGAGGVVAEQLAGLADRDPGGVLAV